MDTDGYRHQNVGRERRPFSVILGNNFNLLKGSNLIYRFQRLPLLTRRGRPNLDLSKAG
jgi:hypothetical protein